MDQAFIQFIQLFLWDYASLFLNWIFIIMYIKELFMQGVSLIIIFINFR